MVILCITMSKMRRSSDCHLRRAALLKVWLAPFLGNFFLQPEGRRGTWATSCTMPGELCLPQKDAQALAGQEQRSHLHHFWTAQLFHRPLAKREMSPAGAVPWHLMLMEGQHWA